MNEIYADLHVHIGRAENGKPVKITGARSLNFSNIAKECYERKGIDAVGIIDCASPYVIEDIENFLNYRFKTEQKIFFETDNILKTKNPRQQFYQQFP